MRWFYAVRFPCMSIPMWITCLGISLGMSREQVQNAIEKHPDAVAVLVNNPTYYGICSDIRAIVDMAHRAGMLCLADEAHGTHFYFGENMPVSGNGGQAQIWRQFPCTKAAEA